MTTRPRFKDLPRPAGESLPLAWGLENLNVGMLASIGPQQAVAAAALVRTGRRVNLDLPLNQPLGDLPPHSHRIREAPIHVLDVSSYEGLPIRDDCVTLHPQASSQWDSLAHVGDPVHGFYDGTQSAEIHLGEGSRNGVDQYAKFGIFTRGIFIDLPATFAKIGKPWNVRGSQSCSAVELADAIKLAGLVPRQGDVLCVRTGWQSAFRAADAREKAALFQGRDYSGLAGDARMWEFLWDSGFAAIASDNVTVEAWPLKQGHPSLHLAIARLGMVLGEMFDLDALRDATSGENRSEFLFVSKPLNLRGGIGSPPNALAVF